MAISDGGNLCKRRAILVLITFYELPMVIIHFIYIQRHTFDLRTFPGVGKYSDKGEYINSLRGVSIYLPTDLQQFASQFSDY